MADGGMVDQVLGWLRGTPAAPAMPNLSVAPPLAEYPTQYDADYARNYGFADNNINEDYLNNQKARVLGQSLTMKPPTKGGSSSREMFVPQSAEGFSTSEATDPSKSAVVNLNEPTNVGLQEKLTNTMMRAALAANRSPIASVGFDPTKVVVDSLIKKPTIGGLFSPSKDTIYTALSPDDSVLHESTHRGINKLAELYPDKMIGPLSQLPDEEMVVRWLMHSKGGDPEGAAGAMDAKQRQEGIDLFSAPDKWSSHARNVANLAKIEELAIEHNKGRSRRFGPQ